MAIESEKSGGKKSRVNKTLSSSKKTRLTAKKRKRQSDSGSDSDKAPKQPRVKTRKRNYFVPYFLSYSTNLNTLLISRFRNHCSLNLIFRFNLVFSLGSPRIKRNLIPWTDAQRRIVRREFANHFDKDSKLPGFAIIRNVIRSNPELKDRTPAVIKAWINNERNKI